MTKTTSKQWCIYWCLSLICGDLLLSYGRGQQRPQEIHEWVREYFAKGLSDPAKYEAEFEKYLQNQPDLLVRSILDYGVHDVKDEIPAFSFEYAVRDLCMLKGWRLRPELVKHLELDSKGDLVTDYLRNRSRLSRGAWRIICSS